MLVMRCSQIWDREDAWGSWASFQNQLNLNNLQFVGSLVPARPSELLEELAEHCRTLGIEPQFFKRVEPIIPGANNVVPLTEPVLVSRLVIDLVHLGLLT